MVGGGSRKDDGSLGISSTNVFAALDSLRKKKKSDKSKASAKSQPKEPQPAQVFWAPTPLTVKSWADVDDEDDDDYYATTAPPQPVWASAEQQNKESSAAVEEETESEDDGLDEMYEDVEEEPEHELEIPQVPAEPVGRPLPTTVVPRDAERQLSKKELKKKELAELDAVLAELGISTKEGNTASQKETHDEKGTETNGNAEKESVPPPSESKTSKKKKKKEKPPKEVKDSQGQPAAADGNGTDEASGEPGEDASRVDLERLKKMTSMKKKKSSKEVDGAAKAAAVEAAARSAKLAAAKKKEKNHYNQQPVR